MLKSRQLCRVCAKRCKSRQVALLDTCLEVIVEQQKEVISYLTAFQVCTQLEAKPGDDGLPAGLCLSCSRNLQNAYNLWRKARESDVQLKKELHATAKAQKLEVSRISDAVPLLENDFDLSKANCCTNSVPVKDPLEDTDTDVEAKMEAVDESEDDKPLKDLLLANRKSESSHPQIKVEQNSGVDSRVDGLDMIADAESSPEQDAEDLLTATESQIFPKGRFKCKICEKCYFTSVGLKAHLDVHLPKDSVVKRKRLRGAKNRKIRDESKNPAPDETVMETLVACNESMATDSNKQTNCLAKSKLPKPKKMFPCHVCGKHMISASKLRYHMVMHTGEKDYLCTMCPKAYSTIYALKHHIRTHTGERPYECKFCGDKFLRPTTLKSHQRRHTGERPYGCDICGKRFIQHSSMTTHMKLNHMDKTIQCPHCDKKYARQTDLNTHLLSHTGDKPYSCQLCSSRFIRQANLNKHMNQHHASKPGTSVEMKTMKTRKLNNETVAIEEEGTEEMEKSLLTDSTLTSNAGVVGELDTEEAKNCALLLGMPYAKKTSTVLTQCLTDNMESENIQAGNTHSNDVLGAWNWPGHT